MTSSGIMHKFLERVIKTLDTDDKSDKPVEDTKTAVGTTTFLTNQTTDLESLLRDLEEDDRTSKDEMARKEIELSIRLEENAQRIREARDELMRMNEEKLKSKMCDLKELYDALVEQSGKLRTETKQSLIDAEERYLKELRERNPDQTFLEVATSYVTENVGKSFKVCEEEPDSFDEKESFFLHREDVAEIHSSFWSTSKTLESQLSQCTWKILNEIGMVDREKLAQAARSARENVVHNDYVPEPKPESLGDWIRGIVTNNLENVDNRELDAHIREYISQFEH